MPNWVTNRVIIRNAKKSELCEFFKKHFKNESLKSGVYTSFDFDSFIPEPRKKEDCPSSYIVESQKAAHLSEDNDRPWFNWYDWHCDYWGTKWDACDTEVEKPEDVFSTLGDNDICDDFEFYFNTAWSAPHPVIEKMAEMYPNFEIAWTYIEEQGTIATGDFLFSNGVNVGDGDYESDSKEAYEVMFDMWGNRDSYIYKDSTNSYIYINEEIEEEFKRRLVVYIADGRVCGKLKGVLYPTCEDFYNNDPEFASVVDSLDY